MFIITLISSISNIDEKVHQITKTNLLNGRIGISALVGCLLSPFLSTTSYLIISATFFCSPPAPLPHARGGGGAGTKHCFCQFTQCLSLQVRKRHSLSKQQGLGISSHLPSQLVTFVQYTNCATLCGSPNANASLSCLINCLILLSGLSSSYINFLNSIKLIILELGILGIIYLKSAPHTRLYILSRQRLSTLFQAVCGQVQVALWLPWCLQQRACSVNIC